jgi:hypothetical protein
VERFLINFVARSLHEKTLHATPLACA